MSDTCHKTAGLVATHEVADCDPTVVVGTSVDKWEACVILRTRRADHDVQIVSDGQVCKNVPKRFVRPLPTKTPQPKKRKRAVSGWTDKAKALIVAGQKQRLEDLKAGKTKCQINAYLRNYLSEHGITKK